MSTSTDGSLRVELFVEDIERTAEFYTRVLGYTREKEQPGYLSMRLGDAVIGIGLARALPDDHPLKTGAGERGGLGVEIVLEVADVDQAHRAVLDAGYPVLTPVGERQCGLRDFRVLDPDGYYVRVSSSALEGAT